jgi:hypothetical protein
VVERSTAWLVAGGNRRVRQRGVTDYDAWFHSPGADRSPSGQE